MPLLEIVGGAIVHVAIDRALDKLLDSFRSSSGDRQKPTAHELPLTLVGSPESTQRSVRQHLEQVQRWSLGAHFDPAANRKRTSQVFVEIDVFLEPLADQISDADAPSPLRLESTPFRGYKTKSEPLLSALSNRTDHCAILGQPGAGKTTSVQKICDDYFDKHRTLLNHTFPILLRLRELIPETKDLMGPVIGQLAAISGLRVRKHPRYFNDWPVEQCKSFAEDALCKFVDEINVVVILDGYDEILNVELRSAALADIKKLASNLTRSKLIVTSRNADFPFTLPHTKRLELAPLDEEQVRAFANKWFSSKQDAASFISKLLHSPFADTAARPLAIAHLCAIFEKTGNIPEKPKSVYRRLVYLLLEDWDIQREVKRRSRYAAFDTDLKVDFLSHLAYELTVTHSKTRFDAELLKTIYFKIHDDFGLPRREASNVIEEIESHSGLVLQSGNRIYEFSHKSLQEFLTAYHIIRLPLQAEHRQLLAGFPNELAIAVALSSNSTKYFVEAVLTLLIDEKLSQDFCRAFLARLQLEKVDFVCSEYSAIAACMLLERAGEGDHFKLFAPMLSGHYPQILMQHYEHSEKASQLGIFTLKHLPQEYKLPEDITVPSSTHRQLLNLPVRLPDH